jgi:hypothetical protein
VSLVDNYFGMGRRDADALAKLTYEGDKPVTENPEEFERFAYYVQQAEAHGILETPSGRSPDGEFKGDWIEVQSLLIEGERRLLGFVPVLTDNVRRLHEYEERLQEGSEQPPFIVDSWIPIYE